MKITGHTANTVALQQKPPFSKLLCWIWMCLLIESRRSEGSNRGKRDGGKREAGGVLFINSVYLKALHCLISINSSDFRKLIFCHWTVLYYL